MRIRMRNESQLALSPALLMPIYPATRTSSREDCSTVLQYRKKGEKPLKKTVPQKLSLLALRVVVNQLKAALDTEFNPKVIERIRLYLERTTKSTAVLGKVS